MVARGQIQAHADLPSKEEKPGTNWTRDLEDASGVLDAVEDT
jgi:hypothetical protein